MDRNETLWRTGLHAAAAWAAGASIDRFKAIVAELNHHEEEGLAQGERRDPANPTGLLADVLTEVTPPSLGDGDHDYFSAGVRSGLLLAWKKLHAPPAPTKLSPVH
ncbi:MAG TPA: hypothetical protein VHY91_02100 [Pirellulales bacterium]|jgi:hypothetical protein|nr:hypothetical protein [Pirellulales bacterium]